MPLNSYPGGGSLLNSAQIRSNQDEKEAIKRHLGYLMWYSAVLARRTHACRLSARQNPALRQHHNLDPKHKLLANMRERGIVGRAIRSVSCYRRSEEEANWMSRCASHVLEDLKV